MAGACYASTVTSAAEFRRRRRLAMGGTFLVAVALAVQLGHLGPSAKSILATTAPVACLGGALIGWFVAPTAALAMGAAATSIFAALGVSQSGSAYTDEMLLFAIPFSAAAVIVMGHHRRWPGKIAIALSLALCALAIGVGMTEFPQVFAVAHLAILISLPSAPLPTDRSPSVQPAPADHS